MLLAEHIITEKQLQAALEEQKKTKQKLGTTLVEMKVLTEQQIATVLMHQLGLDMVELRKIEIPEQILRLVTDSTILKKYTVMPYAFDTFDFKYLKVAMADPMDIVAIDDLSVITGMQITPVIATSTDIMSAIDRYYGSAEARAVAELYAKERGIREAEKQQETKDDTVESAPIVILVNKIIEQAARQRASDIHIEPMETKIRIRYRIDGMMQSFGSYQLNMLAAIITRIKIMGGMDIAEKRKPQDGRLTAVVDRIEYDIRVSVLPTVFGEKIVMRLNAKVNLTRDKRELGFYPEELEAFNKLFSNPNGIILVTGPTGSGKSTTLYTALAELNRRADTNIVTVEDPVEANIDGINQVQVAPKAGLTFATALRSILRQDPDVIMIGEIRDQETASIAVTASITGHLVVSTLHTISAPASITRLADMGIEHYLIADSTAGIIAQRLVRRLCTCKRARQATIDEKRLLGVEPGKDQIIYEPCGCVQCNDTGYRGRIGVYEIMPVTPKLKNIIASKGSTKAIERVAVDEGMSTLRMSSARLVRDGITSIDEMKRIVYTEEE